MLTFIAFLLTIAGCVNWLMIGMLQYDFIAGIFGWQASIFSRIIYILFGAGAIYVVIRIIVGKGSFRIWEKKKSKNDAHTSQKASAVEASEELMPTAPKKNRKWWQFWKKKDKKVTSPSTPPEKIEVNIQNTTPTELIGQLPPDTQGIEQQAKAEQNISQDNLLDEHLTTK